MKSAITSQRFLKHKWQFSFSVLRFWISSRKIPFKLNIFRWCEWDLNKRHKFVYFPIRRNYLVLFFFPWAGRVLVVSVLIQFIYNNYRSTKQLYLTFDEQNLPLTYFPSENTLRNFLRLLFQILLISSSSSLHGFI